MMVNTDGDVCFRLRHTSCDGPRGVLAMLLNRFG